MPFYASADYSSEDAGIGYLARVPEGRYGTAVLKLLFVSNR